MSRWAGVVLVAVGLSQLAGFVVGSQTLRGLGALSTASPLPFVFSAFRGVETFAADFELTVEDVTGERRSVVITPQLYAQLDGPYNRRNAYGAVISYGPALDKPEERAMVDRVLRYGFCDGGPLAQQLGGGGTLRSATITVRGRSGDRRVTQLEAKCAP